MPDTYKTVAKSLGVDVASLKTPEGQEKAMDELIRLNSSALDKLGITPTKATVYVMHQLGATRGKRYFTNTLTSKDYTLMWKNIVGKKRASTEDKPSNTDIRSMWDNKFIS